VLALLSTFFYSQLFCFLLSIRYRQARDRD
jgi:hypothetical protein